MQKKKQINCAYCGEPLIKKSNNQKYHPACSKEIRNKNMRERYHKNKEIILSRLKSIYDERQTSWKKLSDKEQLDIMLNFTEEYMDKLDGVKE